MFAVEKYYDTNYSNSRIMLDRINKVVIVIGNALNTIITTYKLDSISTIQNQFLKAVGLRAVLSLNNLSFT